MTEEELKQQTETPESQETETQNQKNDSAQTAQNQTTEENQTKENSTAENAEPNAGAASDSEEEKPQELTDAQKIEQLEKENADLKKKNTALRQDWDVMKSTITDYEKENEELTKKLEGAERARDYWKDSSFDWRHKCTSRKPFKVAVKAQKQLSKAKALLAKWVELYKPKLEDFPKSPIQVDTEQFLKEIEDE